MKILAKYKVVVFSLGLKIAFSLMQIGTVFLLARYLGPSEFGWYTLILSYIAILGVFCSYGFPNLLIREISKLRTTNSWTTIDILWKWSRKVVFTLCVVVSLLALSVSKYVDLQVPAFEESSYLAAILLLVLAMLTLYNGYLRGLGFPVLGQFPELFVLPLLLLVITLFYSVLHLVENPSYYLILKIHLFSAVVALFVSTMLGRGRCGSSDEAGSIDKAKLLVSASSLALISGIQIVNHQADIIIIAGYMDSENVGVYKGALTIATAIIFAQSAIQAVYAPIIARLHHTQEKEKLQSVLVRVYLMQLVLIVPLGIGIVIWPESALTTLFGVDYISASSSVRYLAIGQIICSFAGPSALYLAMTGSENRLVYVIGFFAVMNISVNLILVPLIGMEGAAIGTAASSVFMAMLLTLFSLSKLGYLPLIRKIF